MHGLPQTVTPAPVTASQQIRTCYRLAASADNVNHVFVTTTDHHLQETDGDHTAGTWNSWAAPTGASDASGVTTALTH